MHPHGIQAVAIAHNATIRACSSAISDLIGGIKNAIFGTLISLIGPAIAPHVLLIAQCLQLSMGIMAVVEVGVGFKEIHTLAQAVITALMTLIALPDSFSWAIKSGTWFGDRYNSAASYISSQQQHFVSKNNCGR